MDAIVQKAMIKWPNVPNCFGWLGLDARGNWYLRDAAAQACGDFASGAPGAKGALLRHEGWIAFIGRNYEADEHGAWYFQNGPQRVFVELEATPWIWRIQPDGSIVAHTGKRTTLTRDWTDEAGRVFLSTDLGFGLVHTQDVADAADAIEQGRWPAPLRIDSREIPARFGFIANPQARH
jgi:hypothetical protein